MNNTTSVPLVASALALLMMAAPSELQAQERSGAEIWRATCGNCHALQPPGRYTAKDWRSIGTHMVITARLTTAQGEAVLEFLRQGARATAEGPSDDANVARANRAPDVGLEPEVEPKPSSPAVRFRLASYLRELRELDRPAPPSADEPVRED